jgi:hypothetical protein
MTITTDEWLAHYGVMGMKWGKHKKQEDPKGSSRSKAPEEVTLSKREQAVLSAIGANSHTEANMAKMLSPEEQAMRKAHRKKVVIGVGIGVGVAAVGVAAFMITKKQIQLSEINGLAENRQKAERIIAGRKLRVEQMARAKSASIQNQKLYEMEQAKQAAFAASPIGKFMASHENTNVERASNGLSKEYIDKLSHERMDFPAGSIFKRMSTQKETEIRPGGFYASFKDEDVERYKAVLPIYWKTWGFPPKEGEVQGFIVKLTNNEHIKAPSPKETFDMFRDHLMHEPVPQVFGGAKSMKELWSSGVETDDELARKLFPKFAQAWAQNEDPLTKKFFAKLKDEGFNAVMDFNDADNLSNTPMRFLDGNLFSVAGHEDLTKTMIEKAQDLIAEIKHMIQDFFNRLRIK